MQVFWRFARANALPKAHLSQKQSVNETQFIDRLLDTLKIHGTNFILLVGYMKQLHPRVIQTYRNRIISIHPALLPKYGGKGMYGASVHEAVIAAREKFSGATVHVVDEEYDRGPIVLEKKVAVAPDDRPETLAAKVLAVEHEIYPAAVKLFAGGKTVIKDDEIAVNHS